jgi:hypothetical protein
MDKGEMGLQTEAYLHVRNREPPASCRLGPLGGDVENGLVRSQEEMPGPHPGDWSTDEERKPGVGGAQALGMGRR